VRERPRSLLLLLLALHVLSAGCGKEKATALLVQVVVKNGVARASSLEVTFSHGGDRLPNILSAGGELIPFPTSFVILANGREGPVEVAVKAKDASEYVIGEGLASGTLIPDGTAKLQLVLYPTDFQVNARFQGDQFFSTEAAFGRGVAAAPEGSFVGVWEDACGPLARCDIYYRLFDRTATPRLNVVTGKSEEHTANQANDVYDMPAVAMQESGNFVVAWQRSLVSSSTFKIYSRAFTSDGRPDPGAASGGEVEISGSDAATAKPSVPYVAALRDKGYVVVWQQQNGSTWEIKGRYLGSSGAPAAAYNGSSDPFTVTSFTTASTTRPAPAVAPGVNQGFMVVWNEGGAVKGRPYGQKAVPLKAAVEVDATKSGKVEEINIGTLSYGYAVIWTDTVKVGPDTDGSSIRIRRFELNGAPFQTTEGEYTVNTSVAGNQSEPAIATRVDGSLLAVWTTAHTAQDPEGGIRGRRILSNFLPVGNDFAINTTQVGPQEKPSVAAASSEGFIVLFVDSSKTSPDTLGSGIRGRLVYPEYRATDGQIGALCDDVPCGANLSCKVTETGNRCVARCEGTSTCDHGGVCKTLSGTPPEKVCIYNK
jgi:hypothetical protein